MRQGRVRTESMAQRLSKKPISEGYELWDRGFILGAMRLFIFKSENSPPFQLGSCLDAVAEILMQMGENEDAAEHFDFAADKYGLIQQPAAAMLMRIKKTETKGGPAAALKQLVDLFSQFDPTPEDGGNNLSDVRVKSAVARAYAYRADLLLKTIEDSDEVEKAEETTNQASVAAETSSAAVPVNLTRTAEATAAEAVVAAKRAVELGWDRAHLGYVVLGDAYALMGDLSNAREAYQTAITMRPHYLLAYEHAIQTSKALQESPEVTLALLNSAIEIHSRATLLREKAFTLSEAQGDAAALAFLNPLIESPPPEEAEAGVMGGSNTVATLLKAKAAILADGGKLQEALEAVQKALELNPDDAEASAIAEDIKSASA